MYVRQLSPPSLRFSPQTVSTTGFPVAIDANPTLQLLSLKSTASSLAHTLYQSNNKFFQLYLKDISRTLPLFITSVLLPWRRPPPSLVHYHRSLLIGLPDSSIRSLQSVLNGVATMNIFKCRSDFVIPCFKILQKSPPHSD